MLFDDTSRGYNFHEYRTLGYILTLWFIILIAIIAGLAWNEAFQAWFQDLFKDSGSVVATKFIYAIAITLFLLACFYIFYFWYTRCYKNSSIE